MNVKWSIGKLIFMFQWGLLEGSKAVKVIFHMLLGRVHQFIHPFYKDLHLQIFGIQGLIGIIRVGNLRVINQEINAVHYKLIIYVLFLMPTLLEAQEFDDCYSENPDKNVLRELVDGLVKKKVRNQDEYEVMCQCLYQIGEYKEAYSVAQDGLMRHGALHSLHQCSGKSQYGMGDYEEAVKNFKFSIDNNLGDYESWIYLSRSYAALGEKEDAEQVLRHYLSFLESSWAPPPLGVLRESYEEVEVYIELINFLQSAGRESDARKLLSRAIQRNSASRKLEEFYKNSNLGPD